MDKYDINDLVAATVEHKPNDFQAAFTDLVLDRIRTAVEGKKVEIAQQMYNYEPTNEEQDNGEDAEGYSTEA